MSAIRQIRLAQSEAASATGPDTPAVEPVSGRDNPLQLLRDAIAQLKSPTGALPDQEQLANLLAEAREALEHANVVSRSVVDCDAHLGEGRFEQAFKALDEGLHAYPDDPMLVARRSRVEEQQKAFSSAAAVRGAIEEAKWLLDHDRTDLAAQFLKGKAAELPDQEELNVQLAELEALLPEWEQKRQVQDALTRVVTLEQMEQWQAALTVIEEARHAYPANAELRQSADRIRGRLEEHERRKKLARRIELIRQQIAARFWRQALTLLENTQLEYPETSELKPLRQEITIGLRRSECEETVAEVRKHLADGDLEQAEQVLQRGMDALGAEPALEAIRKELEAEEQYNQQLHNAQILFGRRQLEEAEGVLTRLLAQDRPEARALLEAVQGARAASDEENFLDRGREKALGLIQQQQFTQAADLLRNLLSLFPGNPILERDLAVAQAGVEHTAACVVPEPESGEEEALVEAGPPAAPAEFESAAPGVPGRFRRVAIAGTASLVLASAAGTAWKLSQRAAPVSPSVAESPAASPTDRTQIRNQTVAQSPVTEAPTRIPAPAPQVAARQPVTPAAGSGRDAKAPSKPENTSPLRAFIPPNTSSGTGRNPSGALPLPPGADPAISFTAIPVLPDSLNTAVQAPPTPPVAATSAPAPAAPKPAVPVGGRLEQAVLIKRALPAYPTLARDRAVTGVVRLTAVIDEHGDVKSVKVLTGDVALAAAAKAAVLTWKYRPALLNGQPVPTSTEIQMVFGNRDK